MDEARAVGLHDPPADGGSEMVSEAPHRSSGRRAPIAKDERDFLQQFFPLHPAPATGRLAEGGHHVVGHRTASIGSRATKAVRTAMVRSARDGRVAGLSGWTVAESARDRRRGSGCRVGVVFAIIEEAGRGRGGLGLAAPTGRGWLGLALLVVEALGDLLGVPLVVQLQKAGEDFAAGRLADREPECPAWSRGSRDRGQGQTSRRQRLRHCPSRRVVVAASRCRHGFVRVMEKVVKICETQFSVCEHRCTEFEVRSPKLASPGSSGQGKVAKALLKL